MTGGDCSTVGSGVYSGVYVTGACSTVVSGVYSGAGGGVVAGMGGGGGASVVVTTSVPVEGSRRGTGQAPRVRRSPHRPDVCHRRLDGIGVGKGRGAGDTGDADADQRPRRDGGAAEAQTR